MTNGAVSGSSRMPGVRLDLAVERPVGDAGGQAHPRCSEQLHHVVSNRLAGGHVEGFVEPGGDEGEGRKAGVRDAQAGFVGEADESLRVFQGFRLVEIGGRGAESLRQGEAADRPRIAGGDVPEVAGVGPGGLRPGEELEAGEEDPRPRHAPGFDRIPQIRRETHLRCDVPDGRDAVVEKPSGQHGLGQGGRRIDQPRNGPSSIARHDPNARLDGDRSPRRDAPDPAVPDQDVAPLGARPRPRTRCARPG